jgi:hypothetical protein
MELLFHRVYEVAEMMAEVVVSDSDPFEELDWESPAINECLNKFSRTSLLGHFCFKHLSLFESRRFRKDPETVNIESIQLAFQRYAVHTMPFEDFLRSKFPEEKDEQEAFHPWMLDQENAFEQLWNRMTDEVFHILFGNRGFLLNFNLALAEYRKQRGDSPSPRCAIPQWVKKAVYFRENDKCALCKRDLSGLVALDSNQHYDHIVALKALGPNDPSNVQLLCARCNLLKGASTARTSSIYDPWWNGI